MYKPLNSNLPNCFNKHTQYLKKLACHSIDIEARSRRNNRIFYGLADLRDEDTYELLSQFLYDTMDIDLDSKSLSVYRGFIVLVPWWKPGVHLKHPDDRLLLHSVTIGIRNISCKMLPNCLDLNMVLILITPKRLLWRERDCGSIKNLCKKVVKMWKLFSQPSCNLSIKFRQVEMCFRLTPI